jgi:Bacteriophage head to tail connecting protein
MLTSSEHYDDLANEGSNYKTMLDNISMEQSNRTTLNDRWIELWSLYKTLPLRLADEDGSWKSKLNDGRVFEVVETIASYLRSALFFSDSWLELEAREPELGDIMPIVNAFFRDTLNGSNFKREFRIHLRQLLLLGFSGMSVDYVDGKLVFNTINSYDLYIESTRRFDENSYSFRRIYLNKSLFLEMVDNGELDVDDAEEFWEKRKAGFDISRASWKALDDVAYTEADSVTMIEYWEPIDGILYRLIDDECVGEEELDCCPWMITSIYELPNSAYGLSQLDNSIGLMLENNCIMNRRLDNMALSVDNMWMFVDDGVTNPDDIKSSPGKVIPVSRPDVLTPLYPPPNNFQVTYEESALIDQRIDKNTGTGALISSGQYRSGDRVTAQEINAVKDAGGNRLTDLYEHLENEFIIPMLRWSLELCRKHKVGGVVKLASAESGIYDYFRMLPKDLHHDFSIRVRASQSVINRDRNIRKVQEFIALVNSVPQFAEFVDYKNLYTDVLYKFGFDDPERYMVKEEPEQPQQAASVGSPMDALMQEAGAAGGAPTQQALTGMAASGSLNPMLNEVATGKPSAVPTLTEEDPTQIQQQMLAMQQPLPTA